MTENPVGWSISAGAVVAGGAGGRAGETVGGGRKVGRSRGDGPAGEADAAGSVTVEQGAGGGRTRRRQQGKADGGTVVVTTAMRWVEMAGRGGRGGEAAWWGGGGVAKERWWSGWARPGRSGRDSERRGWPEGRGWSGRQGLFEAGGWAGEARDGRQWNAGNWRPAHVRDCNGDGIATLDPVNVRLGRRAAAWPRSSEASMS